VAFINQMTHFSGTHPQLADDCRTILRKICLTGRAKEAGRSISSCWIPTKRRWQCGHVSVERLLPSNDPRRPGASDCGQPFTRGGLDRGSFGPPRAEGCAPPARAVPEVPRSGRLQRGDPERCRYTRKVYGGMSQEVDGTIGGRGRRTFGGVVRGRHVRSEGDAVQCNCVQRTAVTTFAHRGHPSAARRERWANRRSQAAKLWVADRRANQDLGQPRHPAKASTFRDTSIRALTSEATSASPP